MSFLENAVKKLEYVNNLRSLDPYRTKFLGEKKLTCPFYGTQYYAVLFCGINSFSPAVRYGLGCGTINSSIINDQIMNAIHNGWLRRGDVLVMSESKIHTGGSNDRLEDWLWKNYMIFVMYLPPGTTNWTPVTKLWKEVTRDVKDVPKNPFVLHSVAHTAEMVLNTFTHQDVMRFYNHCYAECGV